MAEIYDIRDLDFNAETLAEFIQNSAESGLPQGNLMSNVYVQDDTDRVFTKATIMVETLTDGSKVCNLILSE